MTWGDVIALLTSIGFGVVSAVFPVINAEAYVLGSQVTAVAGTVPIAVGVAMGQTVGKLLLFYGVRRGKDFPFVRRHRARSHGRPVGGFRRGVRRLGRRLLRLVGSKRWGLPITFVAAVIGLPPLYAVALLAGATRMRPQWFALAVLLGRTLRFVLVALGLGILPPGWRHPFS
ncbi:membrane protein YqaA with SNARE-associated domain [Friedmanniella endophytica]|uniref:Membrane protein YqaA with SNARE-associated domain n=1 Tax=Microlunatus kandeliicorticis TaxID=1759536 RepID=A0A7W3ITZ4_9ACTN|nr:hypothetical protein [Microlunatus kandeliicorticis]MBA8795212.1 membrane protein YqaA with SNARE-associated domain [Microlunatus kandeliicorticis]